jgi:hypothetical protein
VARKRDLRIVDAVLREFRIEGRLALEFRDYIHECKESGDFGTGNKGDYTMEELREKLREFLGHRGM